MELFYSVKRAIEPIGQWLTIGLLTQSKLPKVYGTVAYAAAIAAVIVDLLDLVQVAEADLILVTAVANETKPSP